MNQQVRVVYEDGVLKPLEPVNLAEHQQVLIAVVDEGAPAGAEKSRNLPSTESPRSGPELAAYWQREGVFGSRPDIVDSVEYARSLRRDAERRVR